MRRIIYNVVISVGRESKYILNLAPVMNHPVYCGICVLMTICFLNNILNVVKYRMLLCAYNHGYCKIIQRRYTLIHSLNIHRIFLVCRPIADSFIQTLWSPHSFAHGYSICQSFTAIHYVNAYINLEEWSEWADDTYFKLNMNTLVSVEKQKQTHGYWSVYQFAETMNREIDAIELNTSL